jgi:hypothetical protein
VFSLATPPLLGYTISARFKILPCSNVGVGGDDEDAAAAVEAATRLLIVVSIFANASSTLAKTWLRLLPMLV